MKIYDPTRAAYSGLFPRKNCFFCDTAVIQRQECTRFAFRHWHVLVNQYPYMDGNVMLVPKRHRVALARLSEGEWNEFPRALIDVEHVLGELFRTRSFNVGINVGKNSGRSITHLHWQIIPRQKKNHSVVGILADIEVITLAPATLKKRLSKK